MQFLRRVILSLILLATAAVCAAASKNVEPASRSVHRLDSRIKKQCGVTFSVPRGVTVFLVEKTSTTPSDRPLLQLPVGLRKGTTKTQTLYSSSRRHLRLTALSSSISLLLADPAILSGMLGNRSPKPQNGWGICPRK